MKPPPLLIHRARAMDFRPRARELGQRWVETNSEPCQGRRRVIIAGQLEPQKTFRASRSFLTQGFPRRYSGPKSRCFTWKLDKIEPAVSPKQAEFADVEGAVG